MEFCWLDPPSIGFSSRVVEGNMMFTCKFARTALQSLVEDIGDHDLDPSLHSVPT